jgi:hypothetical protein
MYKQNSKYRWVSLTVGVLFFAYMSVNGFYEFANNNKGMKLVTGIVFGVMAIIYFVDLIAFIKKQKSIKAGE